jgi:glucosamine--fructose-6-phosphate aminotransferase (isomerizing)
MEATVSSAMFREAAEAPAAVRRQQASGAAASVANALREIDPPLVVTCARGSSDHAATYLQYVLPILLGRPCYSHPPSLGSLLHATSPRLAGGVMILVSQSGQSPDLLRSAEAARAAGMTLVGLVNDEHSPLAARVDHVIPVMAGPERSVAATKSVIASLAVMLHLAAAWKQDAGLEAALERLPDLLDHAWNTDWSAAVSMIADQDHLFVLGRDLTLGIAGEAALKFKETAGLHAEALSLAEVAHGPMALIGPDMPVLAFPSIAADESDAMARLAGFRDRGASVAIAGGSLPGALALPLADAHPAIRPILALQSFYRLAEAVTRARGRDPDHPPSLNKVTETL